jgi:hypothetical protein
VVQPTKPTNNQNQSRDDSDATNICDLQDTLAIKQESSALDLLCNVDVSGIVGWGEGAGAVVGAAVDLDR